MAVKEYSSKKAAIKQIKIMSKDTAMIYHHSEITEMKNEVVQLSSIKEKSEPSEK